MVVDNPYQDDEDIYQLNDEGTEDLNYEDLSEGEEEAEVTPEEPAETEEAGGGARKLTPTKLSKFIVFGVILLLVVFAGFIFYQQFKSWFFKAKTEVSKIAPIDTTPLPQVLPKMKQPQIPEQRPTVIVPEQPQPIPTQQTVQQLHQATQRATAQVGTMSDQMLNLQEENQKLIESLRNQQVQGQMHMNALTDQITGLKGSLGELQTSISQLADKMQQTQRLEKIIATYRAQAQKRQEQKIREIKRYFVQAVVPGRAWLEAADGTSLTVTVGEQIPGYGQVTTIDSLSGVVSTSSGLKIYYGLSSE